ncbi:acyl-CoA dehydrogenase family protein [Streptomyces sp. 8N706]|uniref:acyl-CoA dehydrogenase family protein n=1 Tax=Streptomyces sp. 8N706 TaxID=3457416 RepID=UPI003FCF2C30
MPTALSLLLAELKCPEGSDSRFSLSAAERRLHEAIARFARTTVAPGATERIRNRVFDPGVWTAAAEFGLTGMGVESDSERGFRPSAAFPLVLALEALQFAGEDSGFTLALAAHTALCEMPIAAFGTVEQRRRHLPGLVSGDRIGALAVSEPGHGSDATRVTTEASATDDGGYLLSGVKSYVSNGSLADVVIVLARTAPGDLGFGLTALLVEPRTMAGVTSRDLPLSGYRSCPVSQLEFDTVRVPASHVLGRPGAGFHTVARRVFAWEQSVMLGPEIGEMQRCLDACVEFAAQRGTPDGPLAGLGQTQRRLASMKTRLETARMAVHRSAWEQDAGVRGSAWGPLTKKIVAENALDNATDAMQIFGAAGGLEDGPIARTLHDARLAGIAGGSIELQEQALTAALVKEHARSTSAPRPQGA